MKYFLLVADKNEQTEVVFWKSSNPTPLLRALTYRCTVNSIGERAWKTKRRTFPRVRQLNQSLGDELIKLKKWAKDLSRVVEQVA